MFVLRPSYKITTLLYIPLPTYDKYEVSSVKNEGVTNYKSCVLILVSCIFLLVVCCFFLLKLKL